MPPRRPPLARVLLALAVAGLVALGGGAAWLLARRAACADGPDEGVRTEGALRWGPGGLWAGAARVPLRPVLPATVAGYGPPRPEAGREAAPLSARALVLADGAGAGARRVGLVTLDLLLVPPALVERVRGAARARGLGEVHVLATHTHSSFGGWDPRAVAQVAGTGAYDAARLAAVSDAALAALGEAAGHLTPVALEAGEADAPELVRNRSGGEPPRGRLTRVRWVGPGGPLAELVVLAAHPTLVPRTTRALDPDWPGRLAQVREAEGRAQVVLVVQGEVGDAGAQGTEGGPAAYAAQVDARLAALALTPVPRPALAVGRASVGLPEADASRLVPRPLAPLAPLAEGALCTASEPRAELALLALGPVRLLLVPGEPTQAAARALADAADGARVVSLADGYVGYVEGRERAEAGVGEARRQYFAPPLVERLAGAARAAAAAAR